MALYVNDSHILYYHMDAVRSSMLGHSYIINPLSLDYLIFKGWIGAMLLSPGIILLLGSHVYRYITFLLGVVICYSTRIPSHNIVAVVNFAYNFVMTAFLSLEC